MSSHVKRCQDLSEVFLNYLRGTAGLNIAQNDFFIYKGTGRFLPQFNT